MGASDVLDYNTTERMLHTKGGQVKSSNKNFTGESNSNTVVDGNTNASSFKERLSLLRQKKMKGKDSSRDHRRKSKTGGLENTSSSDEMSDSDLVSYALPKLQPKAQSGALEYRTAIKSIGSSVQKRLEAEQSQNNQREEGASPSKGSLPALLNEMEDVGDNWLINDVDVIKPKRTSSQVASLFTTSSSRSSSRKRLIEEDKTLPRRPKATVKRSKLSRLENLPGISSSQDDDDRELFNYQGTGTNDKKKNVLSHPELFEDQSSSDACPVTSSTERQEAVSHHTKIPKKDPNIWGDEWDSDEELLSYMDYVDDSFDENGSHTTFSQFNTSTSKNMPAETSNISVLSESFNFGRQSVTIKRKDPNLTKDQPIFSKPSLTLDTLLADKHSHSRPQQSGYISNDGNNSQNKAGFGQSSSSISYSASLQQQNEQHQNIQFQHRTAQPLSNLHHPQHNQNITPSSIHTEGPVLRLKVKIGEQTLLIPIQPSDQQHTILWLCQQAGQRYFNMFLVRPLLTLKTSDGSVLSPTDTISSVLAENDVLTAVVRSWDRPKLEERYLQACTLCLLEEPNKPVVPLLRDCDTSGMLKLCDLGLSSAQLQPVFQAVEGQKTLTELYLTGNRLTDSGVMPLMELLSGLPILKVLSLDSNGLSVEGIHNMAAVVKEKAATTTDYGDQQCLGALTWLSLGHNSLEDAASSALASLVNHLPRLTRLDLPACGFTEAVFTPAFCTALQGRRLESVCFAESQIKVEGISLLLNSLHSDCLLNLDISHTRSNTDKNLLPMLESFAGQECHLTELSLAGCHLTDSDVTAVNRLVVNLKHLTTLSISQNKNVTNKSLQKLLALSSGGVCKLESLTARGCSVTSPLGSELLESLKSKMSSQTPLVKLVFSCRGLKQDEINIVKEIWIGKWKERAQCKLIGVAVSLTVREDR
ncbi:tonsoku-like protein [Elysia marginata]|uniref:Tonsoku-like protein n=1 Tax=Elysia marginata TaxID=1093978 RepID=A0AAV4IN68_9GAST|nr:tonsoku-like protein [Elysia marginata]